MNNIIQGNCVSMDMDVNHVLTLKDRKLMLVKNRSKYCITVKFIRPVSPQMFLPRLNW
ncbi:Uncharacterised protein [Yersinia pseudotuberculosis]|nr:Uncharacterised protein [Yersinia pseudotuberculosis]